MKKKLIIFPVILLLLAGILFCSFVYLKYLLLPVSENEASESVRIEIPSGMSVSGAASLLFKNGLIRNEKLFYYIARYPAVKKYLFEEGYNDDFVLRSGIYYVNPSMNIAQIQTLLSSGQQEYIKVSIPEGLTISKIASELEENRICAAADFISVSKDADFAASKGIMGET